MKLINGEFFKGLYVLVYVVELLLFSLFCWLFFWVRVCFNNMCKCLIILMGSKYVCFIFWNKYYW